MLEYYSIRLLHYWVVIVVIVDIVVIVAAAVAAFDVWRVISNVKLSALAIVKVLPLVVVVVVGCATANVIVIVVAVVAVVVSACLFSALVSRACLIAQLRIFALHISWFQF